MSIKKTEDGGNLFFQGPLLKILFNIVKVVHGSTKSFVSNLLSNGLHEKVMICYLK